MTDLSTMDEGEVYELIDELETAKAGLEAMERLGLETYEDVVRMLAEADRRAKALRGLDTKEVRKWLELVTGLAGV